jgi:hypothetical protein
MSVENPTVRICGKNLLNNVRYTTVQDGVTFTVNNDKSVALKGTAEQDIYFYLTDDTLLEPGTYRLSGSPEGSSTSTYYMYVYPDYHSDQHGEGFTFEVKETTVYSARIYVKKDTVCNNIVFKPQIEKGSKTTAYEPYIGGSIDISHTLSGIPVTSGGNYTDSDGQQWICDEIDLERGMYVQRVGQLTLANNRTYYYNTDTVGKEFFYTAENNNVAAWETRMHCSHFPIIGGNVGMDSDYWTQFSGSGGVRFRHKDLTSLDSLSAWLLENPVFISYILTTPIETPLTAEEITAFKALRTNYPNTTILNDAGAWMSVKYNADTKSYVENPRVLKLTDSSTGVVYELKIVNGSLTVNPV